MKNESNLAKALKHYEEGLSNLCKSQANKSLIWYGQAIRDFTDAITANPNIIRAYVLCGQFAILRLESRKRRLRTT